jgi:hypothetical protein
VKEVVYIKNEEIHAYRWHSLDDANAIMDALVEHGRDNRLTWFDITVIAHQVGMKESAKVVLHG